MPSTSSERGPAYGPVSISWRASIPCSSSVTREGYRIRLPPAVSLRRLRISIHFQALLRPCLGQSRSSSSSSSSSSSADDPGSSSTSDTPPLDDKGDNPRASVRRKLPKVEKLVTDEDRAAEDLSVAKFYEDAGNLNAAYLRARDAVKYQPSDSEAHFVLGHLAQKLNKRDEAIAEYKASIQAEPDGAACEAGAEGS